LQPGRGRICAAKKNRARAFGGGSSSAAAVEPPPAHAEFEIQEATIEQGEIQIQYSGAEHWGLAGPEYDPLRQSHELELQMGITDYWLLSVLALKLNAQLDF
jgi:hypothetical protein